MSHRNRVQKPDEGECSKRFLYAFDPSDEQHVMWLKNAGNAMKLKEIDQRIDFKKIINENPLRIDGKAVKLENFYEWAFVHFTLGMRYAEAVLNHQAWIPPNPSSSTNVSTSE